MKTYLVTTTILFGLVTNNYLSYKDLGALSLGPFIQTKAYHGAVNGKVPVC